MALRRGIAVFLVCFFASVGLSLMAGYSSSKLYRRQAGEADAANKAKTTFVSRMSHELRTPLNVVIGMSELTLGEPGAISTEEARASIGKVYDAGMTLLAIVNDVLDLSKIEGGHFSLNPAEYDLASVINDSVSMNVMRIADKPVNFTLEVNPDLPVHLIGDELRVKQVINNLLSNAFKYTDSGTVVMRVEAGKTAKIKGVYGLSDTQRADSERDAFKAADYRELVISVSDTGVGIRQEDMEKIFDAYMRTEGAFRGRAEGTGLGLPIVKQLTKAMGGDVTVESEYGKGSVFTATMRQWSARGGVIGKAGVESLTSFQYTAEKRNSRANFDRVQLPGKRVMVVDDVITNLDVARGMLKPYGLKADCVTSGKEALEVVKAGRVHYDMIFLDHMMPGMDGIETLAAIRAVDSDLARTVPIVALTANAAGGAEDMFLEEGFQGFISKPIDPFKLDAAIKRFLRE